MNNEQGVINVCVLDVYNLLVMITLLNSERRNIYLYYLLVASMNMWFIASNWIYFWTKYMTYGQLGWVDALGFGFAVLLEVPSGAIADLLGRRKTILLGMIAGAAGVLMITFSGNLPGIFIGWLVTQICYAFFSGAAEALTYDTLIDLKQEESFDVVTAVSSQIESYVGAITTFIGGFLYELNFRLPHVLWGLSFVFGAICAYLLIEPRIDSEKFSFKAYRSQLLMGVKTLTQSGLRQFVGFFFVLVGIHYLYSWGFVRPAIATSFGFFAREQSIILPALAIYGAILVKAIPFLKRRVSDVGGLIVLSLVMALGFFVAAFPVGYYGIIAMILIATAGKLANPWISIVVNKKIESKYRATTLSTVALMTKIPYVLTAVLAGQMIEEGHLANFNFFLVVVIVTVSLGGMLAIYLPRVRYAFFGSRK